MQASLRHSPPHNPANSRDQLSVQSLNHTLPSLQQNALKRWHQASEAIDVKAILKQGYTLKQQKQYEAYLETKLESLLRLLNQVPQTPEAFLKWKHHLKVMLTAMLLEAPFLNEKERQFMSNDQLLQASEDFIERALTFDGDFDFESLGQALRNFWIATLFQVEYGMSPEVTDALFGYSMLYPLTDNLMDDPALSEADKRAFCQRLHGRLLHKFFERNNSHDSKVYDMLDLIDQEYPPDIFENVHASILAIHKAQEDSLRQQSASRTPYAIDLLGLSFYKGGTSVLADAYLVKGELDEKECQFAFDFGALLQLCDDLQDAHSDYKEGHMTIFSQSYKKEPLDVLIYKLLSYNEGLIHSLKHTGPIIQKNCTLLILGSALMHPEMLSWHLRLKLPKYFPIRIKALKKLQKRMKGDLMTLRQSETKLKHLYLESLKPSVGIPKDL